MDLWINNAGTNGYAFRLLADQAEEDIVSVVETNVLGVMLGCREVRRGGAGTSLAAGLAPAPPATAGRQRVVLHGVRGFAFAMRRCVDCDCLAKSKTPKACTALSLTPSPTSPLWPPAGDPGDARPA